MLNPPELRPEDIQPAEPNKNELCRLSCAVFTLAFVAFAYFHQGGSWNSAGRFAMVRAVVERGEFAIDSYLVYRLAGPDSLQRVSTTNAEFESDGRTYVLLWPDADSRLVPVDPKTAERAAGTGGEIKFADLRAIGATADVSYHRGHFHPNKAPGTSFLAVPAYALIYWIERAFGLAPDSWWILTVNAWLTSAFSVGLLSALGVLLVWRFALQLSNNNIAASLATAYAFAFGTMFFPLATMFYEHNVIGVCLFAAFFLLYRVKTTFTAPNPAVNNGQLQSMLFLAGLLAGCAAISNYIGVAVVLFLGIYLGFSVRRVDALVWFGVGLLGPFILICVYNAICFGTPFTTNYQYQTPVFTSGPKAVLGILGVPQWKVLFLILFSPFRGLFFTSPVLLIGVAGLIGLFRQRRLRAEACLITATVGFFVLFNVSFNGWDGGWAVVPRYLGPAMPFLAVAMVPGFIRFFKLACALAILSAAIMALVTAVTPYAPVDVNATAAMNRSLWQVDPLFEYELPTFLTSRPGPLMRIQEEQVLRYHDSQLAAAGATAENRASEKQKLREEIESRIAAFEPAPLDLVRSNQEGNGGYTVDFSTLSTINSPVSVNAGGVYGGWVGETFGLPNSAQARWNSFNAGEFVFPESRWSLLPLFLCGAAAGWVLFRGARTANLHSLS